MSETTVEVAALRDRLGSLAGWAADDITIEPAIPILASPSWRGVDGFPWRAVKKSNGESVFIKVMDRDAALYVDIPCAFEAAQRASDLGIGPKVMLADIQSGTLIMEDLNHGWRVGTLERMLEPAIVDAVIAARRLFQTGKPLPRRKSVFDEIEHFYAAVVSAKAQLPVDVEWLVDELRFAAAVFGGLDITPVPIHGDGNVSNILISDAGEVRLIDWDRATTADPLEDLGSFLVEAFDQEPEARDAFIRNTGAFDEAAFNRARIYGVADDLRWGLIGALLAAKSARNTLEFYKFASWRFVRCRMAVREPRFGEALRRDCMTVRRKPGEATTVHERNVENAIERVPQWHGREAAYTPLVGGLMNQNWLVEVAGDPRRYFIKVPGEGSEMFIDRVAANEAARNAHAMGIAPEVVFFDAQDGLEVSEFLEGYRACTNGDFGDAAIQSDVLGLYRRLHAGPKLSLTKTIFDMIEEHVEQGRELGSHFPHDMSWIMHRYGQAKAAFMASGLDLVPCFNDPMPGNFLIGAEAGAAPKPMRLIDYEFASNNERSYELGVLFAEMFFDERLTTGLIEQYLGAVRPQMVARVIVNRALADIKWASWAVVNRKLKEWDFDYQKYGVWKYMRARDVMYDPRWESWLRMI